MGEPIKRRDYAKRWLRESVVETSKSGHSAALFTSLAIVVLGSLLNWYRLSHPAHGKAVHVSVWGAVWPSLAVAVVVLLGFLMFHIAAMPWRFAKAEQAKLDKAEAAAYEANARLFEIQKEPLSDRHTAELKEILQRVVRSVATNHQCDFGHTTDRNVVFRHFPQLIKPTEDWDHAIQLVYDRSATLEAQFRDEMRLRGLTEEPYLYEALAKVLVDALRHDLATYDVPSSLPWQAYGNWVQIGNTRVITFPDVDDQLGNQAAPHELKQLQRKIASATGPVEALWEEAHSWPTAEDFRNRDTDTSWPELQPLLLDELDALLKRDHFKKGLGCERCE